MGIFNLIKRAAPRSRIVNIDMSLGNVLLAGTSPKGMALIMRNYAVDTLNNNGAVVIFREAKNGFSAYPAITTSSSVICEISDEEAAITEQLNPFTNFSEAEINAYIVHMFDSYSEMDKTKKMSYQSYLALLRSLLKREGRNVKLDELHDYSIEYLEQLNAHLPMPEAERNRNERFLNSFLTDVREIEAYFYDFSTNAVGQILSGNKSMERILSTKPIIEISLDFSSRQKESELLMSVLVDVICKLNLELAGKTCVTVIASEIPNEVLINTKFNKLIKSGNDCHVVYTVSDLANLVDKSNEWIEYADSYFFFKQNSNKNKEFCSEFFGTYERTKETTTTGTTTPTFWDMMAGRGSTTRQKSKTYVTEKERVYLPDVFAGLPANEAIYYFKRSNEHSRLTVYE